MDTTEQVSPVRVLANPREVFPHLAERSSLEPFLILAATSGIESDFAKLLEKASPDAPLRPLLEVFAVHTVFGALSGIIGFWALAALLVVATRLMRTPVSVNAARAALAWASLPAVAPLALLWAWFAARPEEFVRWGEQDFRASSPLLWWSLLAIRVAAGLWSLALTILCLSTVTQRGIARAVGAYLLASVTFWGVLNIALFGLTWLAPQLMENLQALYERW
jgi:Yip1-like protein